MIFFDLAASFRGEASQGRVQAFFGSAGIMLGFEFVVVLSGVELQLRGAEGNLFGHVPGFVILFLESERGKKEMADVMQAIRGQGWVFLCDFRQEGANGGVVSEHGLLHAVPREKVAEGGLRGLESAVRKPLES